MSGYWLVSNYLCQGVARTHLQGSHGSLCQLVENALFQLTFEHPSPQSSVDPIRCPNCADISWEHGWSCPKTGKDQKGLHKRRLHDLSGPVLRDTARLSQRYPPIARYGVFGVSTWPIGCDTPPFSERFRPWRACEVEVRYPPSKGVSQRYWRDTL